MIKKIPTNLNTFKLNRITDNHYVVQQGNILFNFSFGELFGIQLVNPSGDIIKTYCKEIDPGEEHKKGQHYNCVEPNKKNRLEKREWKKRANSLLSHYKLNIKGVNHVSKTN